MRLPFFTFLLGNLTVLSLFPTLVSSLHPVALSRRRDQSRPPAPAALTSRQYRVARDLLDVCINANVNLLADVSQVLGLGSVLGPLDLGTDIQLCLCLKDLDIYLDTNDDIQALIGLLGKNAIGSLITAVINTSPQSQSCVFPTHAHHTCNTNDPCHYECDTPYVLQGDQCVCAAPYTSCNGVCGLYPQGCGSAVPRSLPRRSNAIVTIAQAKASCKPQETVCGIPGQANALAFECIDTSSTVDSCGGCMTPHPFFEAKPIRPAAGQDCTAISNAKKTSCSEHRCVVSTCADGWMPSSDKAACVIDVRAGSKMRRFNKRSTSVATTAPSTLNSDLVSQLVEIVKLLLDLNAHGPKKSSPNTSSTTSIAGLLADINAATAALINATSSPSSLSTYVGSLLQSCWLLDGTLNDCNCVQTSGLSDFLKDLEDLIAASLALQSWLQSHSSMVSASATSGASSSPSDSVIVGLSDILTAGTLGLLGPVKSGVTVDGLDDLLGPGTSDLLNNLLNGLLVGPDNYKRQAAPPLTANATATVTAGGDLVSEIEALLNSILNLGGLLNLSPSSSHSSSSTGSSASVPFDPSLWTSLLQGTSALLQSPTVQSLCPTLDGLYLTEQQLEAALGLGGPVYANALNELLSIINYTAALQVLCSKGSNTGSVPSVVTSTVTIHATSSTFKTPAPPTTPALSSTLHSVSTSSHVGPATTSVASKPTTTSKSVSIAIPVTSHIPSSTTPHPVAPASSISSSSSGVPIIVGLDGLLNGLGLGDVKGVVTVGDGLLGDDLDGAVNNLLNGLGIGPNGVRSREDHAPAEELSTSSSTSGVPIVVGLDGLLDGLGLGDVKGVVTVGDGLLGDDLDGTVNDLLDGLDLGPNGVRSREEERRNDKRQLLANATADAVLGGSLVSTIEEVLNLVLGLNTSARALPPKSSGSSSVPQGIDSSLVDNILDATMRLLSSTTYAQLFSNVNGLVNATVASLEILDGCSCADYLGLTELQDYLNQLVNETEALLALCPSVPAGSTSSVGTSSSPSPASAGAIEVGLTQLLSALGLNVKADTVVSGLLGDSLDNTVNSLLDSLGIGPSGMKRRVVLADR